VPAFLIYRLIGGVGSLWERLIDGLVGRVVGWRGLGGGVCIAVVLMSITGFIAVVTFRVRAGIVQERRRVLDT